MLRTISLCLFLSSPALAGTLPAPVVGGSASPPGAWPDVAAVLANDAMCTGTLIAPDVVLTAGHCIGVHPVEVVLGSVDLSDATSGEVIAVKSATAYPDWQHSYDVGVLVLEHAATAKPRAIASACTISEHLTAGAKVEVVGFGLTDKAGTGMNVKLHQAMLAVDNPTCAGDPSCEPSIAPGGEFIAGGDGKDACFGDSGGPIFIPSDRGSAIVGVVSRGIAASGAPCGGGGVYVRADKVVTWIEHLTSRTLGRTSCTGAADGPGDGDDTDDTGGCSVGGHALGGAVMFAVAILWILTFRRREARMR